MERRRLAGEIHDGISQRLVSLWYHLLAAEDAAGDGESPGHAPDPDALRRELGVAKDLATEALSEARAAIAGLRPFVLDDLGLGPGLESLGRSLTGVDVDVDIEPVQLPAHVEVALYRIAQEALQNVEKHAEAGSVLLRLRAEEDRVRLVVSDDGRGFDDAQAGDAEDRHGYGLTGMRERAELVGATLSIVSRPGTGTTLEVDVPMAGAGKFVEKV
jgi:signal transduction histidine kinase